MISIISDNNFLGHSGILVTPSKQMARSRSRSTCRNKHSHGYQNNQSNNNPSKIAIDYLFLISFGNTCSSHHTIFYLLQ